ncbi:MAG: hypothetical protein ACLP8A_14495 [Methylovirgula sp.]
MLFLGVVALYLQLAAAGLCAGSMPISPDQASTVSSFPICHSPGGHAGTDHGDKGSTHQQGCPYCTIHCQAAMAMPASLPGLAHVYVVATRIAPPGTTHPPALGLSLNALPRGPPLSL